MAHAHTHDHDHGHHRHGEGRTDYYLEQIFTIGVCGALAAVTFMLWKTGLLTLMLEPRLHGIVIGGAVALFVLVVIRFVAVWRSVGEPALQPVHTHTHDHDHKPDHDHKHDHDPTRCPHQ